MPLFHRKKNKRGMWQMYEVPVQEAPKPEPILMPITATVGTTAGFKRYCCVACTPPKPFAGLGVASMHFGKKHPELAEDKDSWRKYIRESLSVANA